MKVEQDEVTCNDKHLGQITIQRFIAYKWSEKLQQWFRMIATNNIVILSHHVDLSELTEFPCPEWELDAMNYGGLPMDSHDTILPGSAEVGPADDGRYYYRIAGKLSQHGYHNSASAWYDARRPQRVTAEDRLVPDSNWSPQVN